MHAGPHLHRRGVSAAALARGLPLEPLKLLLADPLRSGVPDFTGRMERVDSVDTVADGLELLRVEPRDTVHREIEAFAAVSPGTERVVRPWRHDDRSALDRFSTALDLYWRAVLLHVYPDVEQRLRRETQRLRDSVDAAGPQSMIASLHPKLEVHLSGTSTYRATTARADYVAHQQVRELVVKPIIGTRQTVMTNLSFDMGVVSFACATPALACAAPIPRPEDGLDLLLGPTRARILRRLRQRPGTTTELAAALALAPSTVSYYLSTLQRAGALHTIRRGSHVLYLLTERGHRLLEL